MSLESSIKLHSLIKLIGHHLFVLLLSLPNPSLIMYALVLLGKEDFPGQIYPNLCLCICNC